MRGILGCRHRFFVHGNRHPLTGQAQFKFKHLVQIGDKNFLSCRAITTTYEGCQIKNRARGF
jgi:hypothetical protein